MRRALLRLLAPRHPPAARCSLTFAYKLLKSDAHAPQGIAPPRVGATTLKTFSRFTSLPVCGCQGAAPASGGPAAFALELAASALPTGHFTRRSSQLYSPPASGSSPFLDGGRRGDAGGVTDGRRHAGLTAETWTAAHPGPPSPHPGPPSPVPLHRLARPRTRCLNRCVLDENLNERWARPLSEAGREALLVRQQRLRGGEDGLAAAHC